MEKIAVIVAGGSGQRMQSSIPKQFLLLRGRPVLMHTLSRFAQAEPDIQLILVLPKDQMDQWSELCRQHDFNLEHTVVEGGAARFNSVKNGLNNCPNHGVVAIHDGVRPLVSKDLINRCLNEAEKRNSALPVVAVTQSLRKKTEASSQVINREGMMAVQTPQCFDLELIKRAFEVEFDPSFTDDATVFEKAGHNIHLVEGEETNLKITTPADLKIAEALSYLLQ